MTLHPCFRPASLTPSPTPLHKRRRRKEWCIHFRYLPWVEQVLRPTDKQTNKQKTKKQTSKQQQQKTKQKTQQQQNTKKKKKGIVDTFQVFALGRAGLFDWLDRAAVLPHWQTAATSHRPQSVVRQRMRHSYAIRHSHKALIVLFKAKTLQT